MNRRLIALLAVYSLAGFPRSGFAQTNGAILPEARRASTSAAVAAHVPAIDAFVQAQIARLTDPNARTRAAGRDALIGEVQNPDSQDAYRIAFANALAAQIGPVLDSKDLQTRLNAAVAVTKVSSRLSSPVLEDEAVRLLQDDETAISLWGMKAATAMMPQIATSPTAGSNPLISAIVPAVRKAKFGPLADEAYKALTLAGPVYPTSSPISPSQFGSVAPRVVPTILDLLEARLEEYEQGIPGAVSAENRATLFLSTQQAWASLPADTRARAVAGMSRLISLASDRYAEADTNTRPALGEVVILTGKAFYVLGSTSGKPAVVEAATPVSRLTPVSPPDAVAEAVAELVRVVESSRL